MIWLMEILKIQIEEQLLIKYDKHLILPKIENMGDINVDLFQWSLFFYKKIFW